MPRPARLFLHIGLPKTGTTAWQEWADRHRAALLAQGVDYPVAATISRAPNHSAIQPALMRGDAGPLLAMVQGARGGTLLISAEGLSANLHAFPEQGLAAFRAAMPEVQAVCILVTRDRDGWLRSMHRQAVLNRHNPRLGFGLDEDIEAFACRPHIRAMLDHAGLATAAAARFGAVRTEVIPYGAGAFAQFCATVGVDAARLPPPERVNESVSDAVAAVMRQVNALGPDETMREAVLWLMQQVQASTHNRMRSAAAPDAAALAALRGLVARLRAANGEEAELVGRMAARLGQTGDA